MKRRVFVIFRFHHVACGEYEMAEDLCIHFSCTSESAGSCLSLPTSYLPSYFTCTDVSVVLYDSIPCFFSIHF